MPLMAAWRRFPEGRIGPTRIGRRRSSPVSCPGTRESGGLKLAGVTFEWDPRKAAANFKKHGVAFEDASSVFFDPLAMTYPDPDDSLDESIFSLKNEPGGRERSDPPRGSPF